MKRVVLVLATVLALVVPTAAALAAPALRTVRLAPVVVRGAGFRAGERVSVVLTFEGRYVVRTVASRKGTFTAAFTASVTRCGGYAVRAAGNHGSVALIRVHSIDCPQP